MYDDRYSRRYYRRRYRNPLGGIGAGLLIIALAFAFAFSGSFSGHLFLPILFVGLAFCSLLGSASSLNPRGLYGGLQGFVWCLGLALCFLVGFWPWILLPVGVSIILGTLLVPITNGLASTGFLGAMQPNQQPPQYQQPYPPGYQQPPQQEYQSYQQGYQQPPQQAPGTYQEGGQQHQYPQPKQEYDQPQSQPAQQQEMPPQQQ
jgi:hypothetical protein